MLSDYQSLMIVLLTHRVRISRAIAAVALLASCAGLAGCADMSDSMTSAFADPARYELYDCKQLEPERKNLAARAAELQGLMAKADTGAAGPLVAELAYRNDYISVRGQAKLAEEAWQRNRCRESAPATPGAATAAPAPIVRPAAPRAPSSGAVY
jgi:hypothetical protein